MSRGKESPWVAVVPGGDRMTLRCERCVTDLTVLLPAGINDIVDVQTGFGRRHRRCQPRPEPGSIRDESVGYVNPATGVAYAAIPDEPKHGPLCECDQCIHGGPTRPDNHFTLAPDEVKND